MSDTADATGTALAVLVLVPRPADRAVICSALDEFGQPHLALGSVDAIPEDLERSGCLLVAQEAIDDALLDGLAAALDRQPVWSEFPVVVMTDRDTAPGQLDTALRKAWGRAKIVYLARPVGGVEFSASIQLAISTRLRQFQTRDQIERERLLRRELNHRVKNVFATVQSVAGITLRTAPDPDTAFHRFTERLTTLDRVHTALNKAEEGMASFAQIADRVLAPYRSEDADPIVIDATDDRLMPEAANVLGLCLFEMATNATKYGALSVPGGRVRLSLHRAPDEATRMTWVEEGGPAAAVPERSGFGSRFVTTSLAALFGAPPRIDYAANGLSLAVEGVPSNLFAPGRVAQP